MKAFYGLKYAPKPLQMYEISTFFFDHLNMGNLNTIEKLRFGLSSSEITAFLFYFQSFAFNFKFIHDTLFVYQVWCGLTNTGEMIAVKQVELNHSNWGGGRTGNLKDKLVCLLKPTLQAEVSRSPYVPSGRIRKLFTRRNLWRPRNL